jgi:hypothetical protein
VRQLAAEITREKLFERLHQELPYHSTVETESWKELRGGKIRIEQTIYVERESQRKIVIGKGGQTLKSIGESSRREIAEIVHDVDCKDGKFRREEAAGLARMITGIVALSPKDEDRVEQGTALFDNLYAAFGGQRSK